ncbi:hypothetical protein [Globicatella sp. PHS-GS-PNBC-21-1553]|nr:hypothetical protein [Globicatella sp. PHS-GS-PNBC-21-1553]
MEGIVTPIKKNPFEKLPKEKLKSLEKELKIKKEKRYGLIRLSI